MLGESNVCFVTVIIQINVQIQTSDKNKNLSYFFWIWQAGICVFGMGVIVQGVYNLSLD